MKNNLKKLKQLEPGTTAISCLANILTATPGTRRTKADDTLRRVHGLLCVYIIVPVIK